MDLLQYIDMQIVRIACGLVLLMVGNILLGSIEAWLNQQFDRKKFLQGVIKAVVVALSLCLVYIAGLLNMEVITVDINGENVNLITGINLVLTLSAGWYAKEFFVKLGKFVISKINTGEGM